MEMEQFIKELEELLECSIGKTLFVDPVTARDAHTYERKQIEQWLQKSDKSPSTGEKMGKVLASSILVKQIVDLLKKAKKQGAFTELLFYCSSCKSIGAR